jgi:hypothetical protein
VVPRITLLFGASPSPKITYESNKIDIIINININDAIGQDVNICK